LAAPRVWACAACAAGACSSRATQPA
jgi:hypothetical protein